MTPETITIGIDNGITGAVVVLFDGKHIHAQTPLFIQTSRKGNEQNVKALAAWFDEVLTPEQLKRATFIFEEPGGSQQAFIAVSMAGSFQAIRALLDLRDYRWHRITPQSWQNKWVPTKKLKVKRKKGEPAPAKEKAPKGERSKETKELALALVNRLFPAHNWLATARSKVPHTGLVDAAIIAYHGYVERL